MIHCLFFYIVHCLSAFPHSTEVLRLTILTGHALFLFDEYTAYISYAVAASRTCMYPDS